MTTNLWALSHMLELRSTPQGHPTYSKVAQNMALKILDIYPEYAPMLKFVDYKNYDLERLEAFKKLQSKGYHFDEWTWKQLKKEGHREIEQLHPY